MGDDLHNILVGVASNVIWLPVGALLAYLGFMIKVRFPNRRLWQIKDPSRLVVCSPFTSHQRTIILFSGGHTYGTIAAARYFCDNMHGQLRHLLKGGRRNFVVLVSAHIIDGYPTKIKMERAYAW